jgi:hypothetical protein
MATQPQQQGSVSEQYNLVYTLRVDPGIKRDGTNFETREYTDGVWCRFQRAIPKKMGGYRQLFSTFSGILRGIILNAFDGVNYVFGGTSQGIDVFVTGTSVGSGSGPYVSTFTPGYSQLPIYSLPTVTSFTIRSYAATPTSYASVFPAGTKVIFSQSGTPVVYTTVGTPTFSTPDTTITVTATIVGTPTNVWLYNTYFQASDNNLWQFDLQYSPVGGALKVLAHPGLNLNNIDNGVETQVQIGNIVPSSTNQWTFEGLADTAGQNPTYRPITVDGGVCMLYPYVFVYGSNGFIANNHVDSVYSAQSVNDWNGATANQVNMASTKIVKGMPTRGGTNSPSGLFWALDSLIRVSFTGAAPLYWRYDIVSSQTSIMSSNAVVEMDGIYYWLGVDRFYLYNGSVAVLPNDKNVNWLFDNINYQQRQKVWATKVPRYNEIWFFYPRGQSTECTDAIIYNVKDKIWYDAGQANGAQRSCGYTTELLPNPIWSDWNYNTSYSAANTIITKPASLPAPSGKQLYIAGNVTAAISPGSYISFSQDVDAPVYLVTASDYTFNATISPLFPFGVTRITCSENFSPAVSIGDLVYGVSGGYAIWQHEYGLNRTSFSDETAITSNFTTCDISWVGGTPSADTPSGPNRRMHLRRIEPDFVQSGEMSLEILGRKFARGDTTDTSPFVFSPETGKIDMRVEQRELSLKFESNTIDGNYELGRILITAEYGDERP